MHRQWKLILSEWLQCISLIEICSQEKQCWCRSLLILGGAKSCRIGVTKQPFRFIERNDANFLFCKGQSTQVTIIQLENVTKLEELVREEDPIKGVKGIVFKINKQIKSGTYLICLQGSNNMPIFKENLSENLKN